MKHDVIRHSEYRPELEGMDPVTLFIIPLLLLLLGIMIIRAITVAMMV
jgi:hypothetical protein